MSIAPPTEKPQSAIPRYRQELRKVIPARYLEPDLANLWWFVPNGLIIGGSFWLLTAHFNWWIAPFLSILVGHSFGCLGFLAHDICHGGSIKNRYVRDWLAGIGFSAFWIGPYLWRRWHNADHHNNTQVEGVDPDHLFTIEDYQHNPVLQFLYRISPLLRNLIIFSSFGYRMTQQNVRMAITYLRSPKSNGYDRFRIVAQLVVPATVWIWGSSLLGWPVLLFGYAIPLMLANAMAISYIATNHFLNPLADDNDVLETSLSVTLPKAIRWLDPWHQAFGAHVSHHLFPQASARYGRKIEEKVAELWPERYHCMSIFKALKLLWQTPWVYEDRTTLLDPHRQQRSPTLGTGLEKR